MRLRFFTVGHHLRSAHVATEREARLLFMSPGNPEQAPQPNPAIDRLLMREDLAKAQYAFPDVRARVDQYETRFRHIYALLRDRPENENQARQTALTNEENTHQTRLGVILPTGYARNNTAFDNGNGPMQPQVLSRFAIAMPTYNAVDAETHSRATFRAAHGATEDERRAARQDIAAIERNSVREMRIMIVASEVDAEFQYTEGIIAGLEQSSNFPGASLRAQLLAERTSALNAQINATNRADKLQTIQIAGYREPMTGRTFPGYHLLRVPGDVTVTLFNQQTNGEYPYMEEVPLSGGAKYYKIPTAFAAGLDVTQVRARVSPPNPARIATIEKDDVNNLIFTFTQPEPERPPEVIRNPEISVGPDISMYTGGNGSIRITGGRDNGLEHAAVFIAHNGALHPVYNMRGGAITAGNFARAAENGDRTVRYPDDPTGVTITFHPDGTIDAVGGNDARTGNNRIQLGFACFRNLTDPQPVAAPVMRSIEVRKIGVQPPAHNFTDAEVQSNAEKEFVIQPADQTANARVWFPTQDVQLPAGGDGVTANGVTVRRAADGKIFVKGRTPTAAAVPLWVDHGTAPNSQAKMRCDVTVERPREVPIMQPGPNVSRYTGGAGTIDVNTNDSGLENTTILIPNPAGGAPIQWARADGEVVRPLGGGAVLTIRANGSIQVQGGNAELRLNPRFTLHNPNGVGIIRTENRDIQIRTVEVRPAAEVTTLASGATQAFNVLDNASFPGITGGPSTGSAQDRDTTITADGTNVPLNASMAVGNGSGLILSRDADGRVEVHATGTQTAVESVNLTFRHELQTFTRQVRVEAPPAPPPPPLNSGLGGTPPPPPEIRLQSGMILPSVQEKKAAAEKAEQDKKNKDAEDQKKKKAAFDDHDLSFAPSNNQWAPTVLLSPEVSSVNTPAAPGAQPPLKITGTPVTPPDSVPITPAPTPTPIVTVAPTPIEPVNKIAAEPIVKASATPAPVPPEQLVKLAGQSFNLPQNAMNAILANSAAQEALKTVNDAVNTAPRPALNPVGLEQAVRAAQQPTISPTALPNVTPVAGNTLQGAVSSVTAAPTVQARSFLSEQTMTSITNFFRTLFGRGNSSTETAPAGNRDLGSGFTLPDTIARGTRLMLPPVSLFRITTPMNQELDVTSGTDVRFTNGLRIRADGTIDPQSPAGTYTIRTADNRTLQFQVI